MSRSKYDSLILELMSAIGEAEIIERFIMGTDTDDTLGQHILGTRYIEINPVPPIVSTLLHEATHYVEPTWDERKVERVASHVYRRLKNDDLKAIFKIYERRKQRIGF